MLDPNTLAAAWALALSIGACFGLGILAVAAIIHILDSDRPRRGKPRRHTWSD